MSAFNKWDASHRQVMRDLIGDGIGIDFTNIAHVLHCSPNRDDVLAALDYLDAPDPFSWGVDGSVIADGLGGGAA